MQSAERTSKLTTKLPSAAVVNPVIFTASAATPGSELAIPAVSSASALLASSVLKPVKVSDDVTTAVVLLRFAGGARLPTLTSENSMPEAVAAAAMLASTVSPASGTNAC